MHQLFCIGSVEHSFLLADYLIMFVLGNLWSKLIFFRTKKLIISCRRCFRIYFSACGNILILPAASRSYEFSDNIQCTGLYSVDQHLRDAICHKFCNVHPKFNALRIIPIQVSSFRSLHFANNLLANFAFIHRTRAFATGIAASTNYIFAFAGTKLYFNFEMTISLPGTLIYLVI